MGGTISHRGTSGEAPVGARPARVRISDVAEALGLAKGTVSRALSGYPDISEATRLRVARTAERMGYVPLAHAQAIRTGRVRALGIVLQVGEHDAQRPFLADFLAGLTTAASAENWTLTVATAPDEAQTLATMRRLIDERKADGFILPRTRTDDARIRLLRGQGVPFVLWGRTGDPEGCAWFDILGEDAMGEAVLRLHDLGHRRIGFLGGGAGFHYTRLRQEGYLSALAAVGLERDPALVVPDAMTVAGGAGGTRRMLALPRPPTALVCATDMGALGAFEAGAELEANKAVYAANRKLLLEELPKAGIDKIVPADGAFYLYCDVSRFTDDSLAFAKAMLEETGVAATPGIDFDAARGRHFIRFSYSGTTAAMAEGAERLKAWGRLKD